jgi:hypothetical protein
MSVLNLIMSEFEQKGIVSISSHHRQPLPLVSSASERSASHPSIVRGKLERAATPLIFVVQDP